MKLILKILAAPIVMVLTIIVWVCAFLLNTSTFVFGIAGTLVGIMAIASFFTSTTQNSIMLLVVAFLVSPMGLPMLAVWTLGRLQSLNDALREFVIK